MTIKEAIEYLLNVENKRKEKIISEDRFVVGIAAIGSKNRIIKYGRIADIIDYNFNSYPQCLIVPGKLHFIEEEMLNLFLISNYQA